PASHDRVAVLPADSIIIDDCLGLDLIYGGKLVIDRSCRRREANMHSLFIEEICSVHECGLKRHSGNDTLVDTGFAISCTAGGEKSCMLQTELVCHKEQLRAVMVTGIDRRQYIAAANFGTMEVSFLYNNSLYPVAVEEAVIFLCTLSGRLEKLC
ncbi:MAG TPA: hypothetical protein DC049_14545, partial [Spirochaetia bacterium]|nr:hypothetical protein [Spirochaetia bacterium]